MSSATSILLATRSEGKLRELRPMFAEAGISIFDLEALGIEESEADEGDLERFESFEENALAKARYFYEVSGGIPTIADDSGLVVDALGGRPGVRSKRFSGRSDLTGRALDDANNAALQAALAGMEERSARFVCVAAWVALGREETRRGETKGRVLESSRGSGGFGYDPYFLSDELGRTFAEAERGEKQRVSHRGRAFRELLEVIAGRR